MAKQAKMLRLLSAGLASFLCATVTCAGPISRMYVSNTLPALYKGIAVIQGNKVVQVIPAAYGIESGPITVDGEIRTAGVQAWLVPNSGGGQYTLNGTATGNSYSVPKVIIGALDSTTDGKHNFLVSYNDGGVWRTNRDFSDPVMLFSLGWGHAGITFDPADDSLWISRYAVDSTQYGTSVVNYSLTGKVLRSFDTGRDGISGLNALALDHADQSLWMAANGSLVQYSKDGNLLSRGPFVGITLGAEFDLAGASIPEPASFALLGTGAAVLLWRRRRA